MDSTRALFASIGVSVSLVAAAALSLFAVSIVIAFGGWSAGMGESEAATTLVFGESAPPPPMASKARRSQTDPVVLRASAISPPRKSQPERARAVATGGGDARPRVISEPVAVTHPPQAQIVQPPPAAHTPPAAGDAVRLVGDGLSSTAQNTGKALADLTAPLGPPISTAVQKVLDLVAALLLRTTNGLGGTLDAAAGQK